MQEEIRICTEKTSQGYSVRFVCADPDTGDAEIYLKVKDMSVPFGYMCCNIADGRYTDFGVRGLYLTDRNNIMVYPVKPEDNQKNYFPVEPLRPGQRLSNAWRRGGCAMAGDVGDL